MNYPTIDKKVKAGFVSRAAKKRVSPAEVWNGRGQLVAEQWAMKELVQSCGVAEAITMQLAIVGKEDADALRRVAVKLASGQLMAGDLLNSLTPEHRRAVLIHALRDMGGRTVRRAVWQRSAFGREWLARPWWAWALALVPRPLRLMLMAGCGREY